MREVDAFEAKSKFGQLLDQVEHGEKIVITRSGKAVAKLVPAALGSIATRRAARSRGFLH